MKRLSASRGQGSTRRGAVLVEFALISLVIYLLIASLLEFGRAYTLAQGADQVARVAARELALAPLPASLTFDEALETDYVKQRIYDPAYLVIDVRLQVPDLDGIPGIDVVEVESYFATLPVVNRALRPLMIRESVALADGAAPRDLIRYPGALLVDPNPTPGTSGLTVGIPQVVARGANGQETIVWRRVLEEARPDPLNPSTAATSPFSALSPEAGLVSVRVHMPYQAAALGSYRESAEGPFEPNLTLPNLADDGLVTVAADSPAAPGNTLGGLQPDGPYGGTFGLGRLYAFGEEVRPFRKLFTAQSIQRRELPLIQ